MLPLVQWHPNSFRPRSKRQWNRHWVAMRRPLLKRGQRAKAECARPALPLFSRRNRLPISLAGKDGGISRRFRRPTQRQKEAQTGLKKRGIRSGKGRGAPSLFFYWALTRHYLSPRAATEDTAIITPWMKKKKLSCLGTFSSEEEQGRKVRHPPPGPRPAPGATQCQ